MPSRSDVNELRNEYLAIRRQVERDLANFWSYLDLNDPERARYALLNYVPLLVQQHSDVAATIAAEWYDDMRAGEGVRGNFRALASPSPYQDAVEGTVRRAAGALWTDRPDEGLEAIVAKAPKFAIAAGRQTIIRSTDRDPRARGWRRVTRSGSCKFCRMLEGRGGVYSKSSAHFASHSDCNCASAPEWDMSAPEVDVAQYEASKRTTKMSPEQKARHNEAIQSWIADNLD